MGRLATNYDRGVAEVTQADYCAKQEQLGLSPQVCATRFANYQARVRGKGSKMEQHWMQG